MGLIGAGFQGRALIAAAIGIPNVRFAAVCGPAGLPMHKPRRMPRRSPPEPPKRSTGSRPFAAR